MVDADISAILEVNRSFYEAFRKADLDAMNELWAVEAPVACTHPGWPCLLGRLEVMESWKSILHGGAPRIRHGGEKAHRLGDAAYVTCTEWILDNKLAATNVFVREGDSWKMAHHHASPVSQVGSGRARIPPESLLN